MLTLFRNWRVGLLIAATVTLACSARAELRAQTLSGLRQDVRSSSSGDDEQPQSDQDDDDDGTHLHVSGPIVDLFATLTAYTISSPFWGPRAIAEDKGYDGYFARYPYHHDRDGFLSVNHPDESDSAWLIRARTEYANDFDQMSRLGGQILLDHASRFGFDSALNYHRERDQPSADSLWTGDANIVFRFAQSETLQMRTGFGVNWLSDDIGTDVGFNFTYGGDWFPLDPWVVSTEIDWGKLGSAGLFHARATIGVHYHRAEIYTGYDYLDIGDTRIDGLVAGVRFWF